MLSIKTKMILRT